MKSFYLNNPKGLNSLTFEIIKDLAKTVSICNKSDSISALLLKGKGNKAFCAGGDVATICK